MKTLLFFYISLTLTPLLHAQQTQKAEKKERKPNIILIYADDLGEGLLGCYGQKIIKTPHIDSLAKEGMKFTNAYGGVYCAPARATLLTGLHEGRKGVWNISKGGGIIGIDSGKLTYEEVQKNLSKHIPAKEGEIFLAQLAQKAGYVTGQFGKLDWGFQTTHKRLTRHGWDHYVGYYDHQRAHGFYPPYLWKDGKKLRLKGNTHHNAAKTLEKTYNDEATKKRRNMEGKEIYSQNVFLAEMLKFIDANQKKPFFLYHSTQLPHGPVSIPEVHPELEDRKDLSDIEKEYGSMVKMLDDHVGILLKKVKDLGLENDTIFIFTSDNGHETYYLNGGKAVTRKRDYHGESDVFKGTAGLAGTKWTPWQGGSHVPLIVRWPNKIQAGSSSARLVSNYDHLVTFADIMGLETPKGKDGLTYLPALFGKQGKEHEFIYLFNRMVITNDGWKLVKDKKEFLLFNLITDPGERKNLADSKPEKLKELKLIFSQQLRSERRDLGTN